MLKSTLNQFQMTNFRLFQTERVCRQHSEFDESSRKFSQQVENTLGKGEIAHYEQFFLFPQYFQKTCTAAMSGLVWERVNSIVIFFILYNGIELSLSASIFSPKT